MGDTWDPNVNPEWRQEIFRKIFNFQSQSKYIILTKQPQNIKSSDIINESFYGYINPENLWVGVSIENSNQMDRWIALSQKEYIKHKIISFEPLMDTLYGNVLGLMDRYGYPDWIIIGALTKSDKVSMAESREAVKQTIENIKYLKSKGVKLPPIFFKDNCGIKNAPKEYPEIMK